METAKKLTVNAFKQDNVSHITIDPQICASKCVLRLCEKVCPAGLYEYSAEAGKMVVEYAGCLECGTCLVACREGALEWNYPRGGQGVRYRHG